MAGEFWGHCFLWILCYSLEFLLLILPRFSLRPGIPNILIDQSQSRSDLLITLPHNLISTFFVNYNSRKFRKGNPIWCLITVSYHGKSITGELPNLVISIFCMSSIEISKLRIRRILEFRDLICRIFLCDFFQVDDALKFWTWMSTNFTASVFGSRWYNGKEETNGIYISDKSSILLGMPRIRQLRIKKGDLHYSLDNKVKKTT